MKYVSNCCFKSKFLRFCYAMCFCKSFRNIFYLRIGVVRFFRYIVFPFFHPESSIEIPCTESSIGGGLVIRHHSSTIFSVEKCGRNCTIYQQVTIGFSNGRRPVFGDNVTIYAGAKVLGGVTVGNNSVVGANAVVTKNIPDNTMVAGIPAKAIRKYNEVTLKWERIK